MTAEEFVKAKGYNGIANHTLIPKFMIEFAKLHVKAALEAAAKNADIDILNKSAKNPSVTVVTIIEDSILNAYPENLIK